MLVNNAGMSPLYPSLTGLSEELWDKVLGVNLKGPFRLAALVGDAHGRGRRAASIINVSSVGAVQPTAGRAAVRDGQGGAPHDDGRLSRTTTAAASG